MVVLACTACIGRSGFDPSSRGVVNACQGASCSGHGMCFDEPLRCVCDDGFASVASSCVAENCAPRSHAGRICDRGDVRWVDSCGLIEDVAESCGALGCSGDVCLLPPPFDQVGAKLRLTVTAGREVYASYLEGAAPHVVVFDGSRDAWSSLPDSGAVCETLDIDVVSASEVGLACCLAAECRLWRFDGIGWTAIDLPPYQPVSQTYSVEVRLSVGPRETWVCASFADQGQYEDNPVYSVLVYQVPSSAAPVVRYNNAVAYGTPGSSIRLEDAARCDIVAPAVAGAFLSHSSSVILAFDRAEAPVSPSTPGATTPTSIAYDGSTLAASFGSAIYAGPANALVALPSPGLEALTGDRVTMLINQGRLFAAGRYSDRTLHLLEWSGARWGEASDSLRAATGGVTNGTSPEAAAAGGLACLGWTQGTSVGVACASLPPPALQ